jgi:cysteine desulfurase
MNEIYLDNNTTTRPTERVIAKMIPFLTDRWGVPSQPHQRGQNLIGAVDEALRGIYALLGAKESDTVLFTSSAAEGINHVVTSTYFDVTIHTGKNHYLTSNIDEAPSLMAMGRLEQLSCLSKLIHASPNGKIMPDVVAESISPRTALISLSWANALTGVINPIEEIASLCTERGIYLHLDASNTLGKIAIDWNLVPAHFLTFNGDSIHAPSGTGALFIRSDVKACPFILGGIEQGGLRAGNYSLAALAALGQASREALDSLDLMGTEVARLRSKLEEGLLAAIKDSVVFFKDQERVPHTTAMAFPGACNEALLFLLNRKKVFASIGGGSHQQIGLILNACGVDPLLSQCAISFSLSCETTEEEIDRTVEVVAECVGQLRKTSSKITPGSC